MVQSAANAVSGSTILIGIELSLRSCKYNFDQSEGVNAQTNTQTHKVIENETC